MPPPAPPASELIQELLKKKTWEDFFLRTPCVKSSLVWGVGVGSLIAAHKLRIYPGQLHHSLKAFTLTFSLITSISFLICAEEVNRNHNMFRKGFEDSGIKEDPGNRWK